MGNTKKAARQKRAAIRLHDQLSENVKTIKDANVFLEKTPLTEKDHVRIANELSHLGDYLQGVKKK